MATWNNVRELVLTLPETSEQSTSTGPKWLVKNKLLAWERPLYGKDITDLGGSAPMGPILAVQVADVGVKEALLADAPDIFFTTSHFNGYSTVLVRLEQITIAELEELIVEAWLARAPKRIAKEFLDNQC